MSEELMFNNKYPDEAEMILMAEWVQKLSVQVPRLKPEYRSAPNAPWSPSEKTEAEIAERKELMRRMQVEQERKRR